MRFKKARWLDWYCEDSRWREVEFILYDMGKAIDPSPGIAHSMQHWDEVASGLREPSRKRKSQHKRLLSHYLRFRATSAFVKLALMGASQEHSGGTCCLFR